MRCSSSLVSPVCRRLFWFPMLQTLLSGAGCCPLIGQSPVISVSDWLLQSLGCRVQCLILQTALCFILKASTIATDKWDARCSHRRSKVQVAKYFLTHIFLIETLFEVSEILLQVTTFCRGLRVAMTHGDELYWGESCFQSLTPGHCGSSAKNVGLPPNIWTPLSHD